MRKVIILAAAFLTLALYNFSYSQAPGPIGTVTFIEGICDIVRSGQESILVSEKEPVYVHDRIRTKSYSKIEITFADKSVLKLAPESCTVIEEYELGEQNKREHSRIQLTRGKIEAIVSKTRMPDTFLIETPNTKGAVKGSDIFVSYLGGKTGVFVQEGAISLLNPAVPDIRTSVVKGNSVLVNFNEAPGEVRPIRDTELSYFKRSVEPAFIKKWIPGKGAVQMQGIIVSLSGTVRLYKKGAGDWREPKLNEAISEGDKLQTEEESRAEISLSNGNKIVLQQYTELIFDTLRYDSASGSYQNTLAVTKGRVSALVERTTKHLTFEVKTPTSVCGVRGTFIEVAVTPPQAAAANASPLTQVFFEGGNGYVTSILTGQTQEIGAGQNAIVDNLGNISEPSLTAPEQRNVIFQTWTSAQTMASYSNADGATGVGSNTKQEPLPQPPVGPMQAGGDTVASLTNEFKNFLSVISSLTFEELLQHPLVITIYDQVIPCDYEGSAGQINMATSQLTIFGDQTFKMTTNGTWQGEIVSWYATFAQGSDVMTFIGTAGDDYTWNGIVSGVIGSMTPNIAYSGQINGTAAVTNPEIPAGTFEGTGTGIWVPVEE